MSYIGRASETMSKRKPPRLVLSALWDEEIGDPFEIHVI